MTEPLFDHPGLSDAQRQVVRDFEVHPGEGWHEDGQLIVRDANGGLMAFDASGALRDGVSGERVHVEGHTARLTGAFWWIVADEAGQVGGTDFYMDREDAEAEAERINASEAPR